MHRCVLHRCIDVYYRVRYELFYHLNFFSPFDGYEIPIRSNSATSGWTSEHSRSRAKSVAERPSGSHLGPRSRFSSTFSRPLSAIYA